MAYSSQAKVASRGYHVYKSLTWSDVKQGDLVTVEIETNKESRKIIGLRFSAQNYPI